MLERGEVRINAEYKQVILFFFLKSDSISDTSIHTMHPGSAPQFNRPA